jgi:hypothetical protein
MNLRLRLMRRMWSKASSPTRRRFEIRGSVSGAEKAASDTES